MSLSKKIWMNEVPSMDKIIDNRWDGWTNGKMIDDCVGVLLSYLPLIDKFRLESVSKQWQRKIYWSVGYLIVEAAEDGKCFIGDIKRDMNEMIYNYSLVSAEVLKMIFKKCHNVECVQIKENNQHVLDSKLLSVIANQCELLSHLKITYTIPDKRLMDFFLKCGPRLKKLEISREIGLFGYESRIDVSCYSVCVNLEEIFVRSNSLVEFNKIHFSKLKSIDGYIKPTELTSPEFASFCNLYSGQLKRIKLTVKDVNEEQLMQLFIQINKLGIKLEFISIYLILYEHLFSLTQSQLNQLMKLENSVWNKLKELEINITKINSSLYSINQSFMLPFLIASNFNLESLKLNIHSMSHIEQHIPITSNFQVVCPKLKIFEFIEVKFTPDGFYHNIHLCFPNVTNLLIRGHVYDPNILIEIGLMSKLESLVIIADKAWYHKVDDNSLLIQFINNYSSSALIGHKTLRSVIFDSYVGRVLIFKMVHEMINFATTIPSSVKITFKCETWDESFSNVPEDKLITKTCSSINEKSLQKISIPENLTIYFEDQVVIGNSRIINFSAIH